MILMGRTVKPYGKVVAVGIRDGELYVMLLDKHKVVSLMPMQAIEAHIQANMPRIRQTKRAQGGNDGK